MPAFSAPNRANVFLYTLYSPPLLRSCRRNVASWPTLMPRYSVMIAAVCCSELGGDLVDDRDLLGTGVLSCHVHLLSLLLGCSLCSEHREERKAQVPDDSIT